MISDRSVRYSFPGNCPPVQKSWLPGSYHQWSTHRMRVSAMLRGDWEGSSFHTRKLLKWEKPHLCRCRRNLEGEGQKEVATTAQAIGCHLCRAIPTRVFRRTTGKMPLKRLPLRRDASNVRYAVLPNSKFLRYFVILNKSYWTGLV